MGNHGQDIRKFLKSAHAQEKVSKIYLTINKSEKKEHFFLVNGKISAQYLDDKLA